MTLIVIGMEAAGRERRDVRPAQPSATRGARIQFTEHVGQGVFALSAICAEDGACVRAVGVLGSLETETVAPQIQRPAPNFQSAHASRAVTAGVLSVISAPLRLFILRAVKVARHLFSFLHSALAVRQDTACQGSNPVRSFSCAVFHDRNTTTGLRAWRAEKPSLSSRNWGMRS